MPVFTRFMLCSLSFVIVYCLVQCIGTQAYVPMFDCLLASGLLCSLLLFIFGYTRCIRPFPSASPFCASLLLVFPFFLCLIDVSLITTQHYHHRNIMASPPTSSENLNPKNPAAFTKVLTHLQSNPQKIEEYLTSNWKDFPPKNEHDIEDLLHFCMLLVIFRSVLYIYPTQVYASWQVQWNQRNILPI